MCVGDDDLVSIAIGLLVKFLFPSNTVYATSIVVLELDKRYGEYIRHGAKQFSLPIEVIAVDLLQPLPKSLDVDFDCMFTDPPYTVDGLELFLSKGLSLLKQERALKIYLSFGNKHINETLEIQELIQRYDLVIRHIYPSFNRYEGASILGNISQMMILESTDYTFSKIQTNDHVSKLPIYTNSSNKASRIYICRFCNKKISLEKSHKFNAIEKLKSNGCPECGNITFKRNS